MLSDGISPRAIESYAPDREMPSSAASSIDLAVAAGTRRATRADGLVPVELNVAPLTEEPPGQVILFVRNGELSYLELVFYEDRPPAEWPASDRLSLVSIDR